MQLVAPDPMRVCRTRIARRQARCNSLTNELRLPRPVHWPHHPDMARQFPCCQSSQGTGGPADNEGGDDSSADIVNFNMLSQAAAKLRASLSDDDVAEILEAEARETVVFQQMATTLGPKLTAELEARVLSEVGDGGFTSDDFEIVTRLGRISVTPASGVDTGATPRTAVIAYAARYIARMSYTSPVTTLIKEYLPIAKSIALNELLLLQHLCGIPEDKYQAAVWRPTPTSGRLPPPVVPLLGYFTSAPSEDAESEGVVTSSGSEDGWGDESMWLVYKWEGLRPLNLYMNAGPPPVQAGFFKSKETATAEAWARRTCMLRVLSKRLLSAVDFIHSADVVHGALSSGSVLMNSAEDLQRPDDDMVVKLDGFGFGKWYSAGTAGTKSRAGSGKALSSYDMEYGPVMLDAALEEGKRGDLQATGVLLVEAYAACLSDSSASHFPTAALRRLMFNVFPGDAQGFRDYCLQDANNSYARLVAFLDDRQGAGWEFLNDILLGKKSALQLSQHAFVKPK